MKIYIEVFQNQKIIKRSVAIGDGFTDLEILIYEV